MGQGNRSILWHVQVLFISSTGNSSDAPCHACLATFALTLLASIASVAAAQSGEAAEHTVTVDGISRKYLVFAPKGFDKPLPVVLAFHGGGSKARQMERYTRFNDLAAKEGFLVVYPEAVDGNWNDGRGIEGVRAQQENIDDVKFVRTILDCMSKEHKIDRSRVFCTGISNGAFMSHRLATEASDVITAIAPVVGGMQRRSRIPSTLKVSHVRIIT